MKQYKQPKTRIKVVEDGYGIRYYAQAHSVLIPRIIEEWWNISKYVGDAEYCMCLYEAQCRIDGHLTLHREAWELRRKEKEKKKVKKKVQHIDYP